VSRISRRNLTTQRGAIKYAKTPRRGGKQPSDPKSLRCEVSHFHARFLLFGNEIADSPFRFHSHPFDGS